MNVRCTVTERTESCPKFESVNAKRVQINDNNNNNNSYHNISIHVHVFLTVRN